MSSRLLRSVQIKMRKNWFIWAEAPNKKESVITNKAYLPGWHCMITYDIGQGMNMITS